MNFKIGANVNRDYKKLLSDYQRAYANYTPYAKHQTYFREALMASSLTRMGASFENIEKVVNAGVSADSINKLCKRLKMVQGMTLKNMNVELDKKVFAALNLMFYQDVAKAQHPSVYSNEVFGNYGSEDWQKTFKIYSDFVYENTSLLDTVKFAALCNAENIDKLLQDPAVVHALSVVNNYKTYYEPKVNDFNYEMFELNRAYQGALLEKNKGKQMYPDANSTMRLSYGKVNSYSPKDAVFYNYYTLADGLLQKYKAGDKEFDLQPKVVDLLKNKDYGTYADKNLGGLVTCFITTNDITGGNSGSPVINGDGELIGCAFDGNWEAMSGDVAFDKRYKRTICADIRYILWVVDKVLDGRRLIDQMTVRY
jgi:hypothetical protein